ncbi:hypothetical protein EBO34_14040 [Alteribacter keqinensis]|uniref:Uncharacterized protein n=1 Tax=Alteribacter keqinensis TaxID=2483800 RepID=A0A3M7TTZ6_9BACI|nr:hypothetical protein EBO34_14040 [Alteribacter keqinensis]
MFETPAEAGGRVRPRSAEEATEKVQNNFFSAFAEHPEAHRRPRGKRRAFRLHPDFFCFKNSFNSMGYRDRPLVLRIPVT